MRPRTARGPGTHQGRADATAQQLLDRIVYEISEHPRSQQRRIGPSEVGTPCDRELIAKLAGLRAPARGPAWKPAVGTAVHAQLEEWFTTPEAKHAGYLAETRVTVGTIGGTDISGTCDLFTGTAVVDWKCVAPSRLTKYKATGPGEQYRIQAHLYGRGFELLGTAPEIVMIAFLPRDGELTDAYWWWEPFQPEIAVAALERAERLRSLAITIGAEQAMALFDPCESPWCSWCQTPAATSSASTMFQTTSK